MKSLRLTPSAGFLVIVLLTTAAARPARAGDWPRWRGPNRDGISQETGLLEQWPEGGPAVAWKVENAGVGYSSVSVYDGRIFTQGDLEGVEHVICYREDDGSLLWAVQPGPVAEALDGRIAEQFERLDANRDGVLDEVEALKAMGWSAGSAETPTEGDAAQIARSRAARLIEQLDTDGDGHLTFNETLNEVPSRAATDLFSRVDRPDRNVDAAALAQERVKAALAADADGDLELSRREARGTLLEGLFTRIDQRKPGERRGDGLLTEEELTKHFTTRDSGRDGRVSAEELAAYYERIHPGRDGVFTMADLRRHYGGYRNGAGDGPRGTPTVDGDRVFAEGGNGDVTCLDAATGKTVWHVNLVSDLEGGRPGWGYSESPLVVGDLLIVTPGGDAGTVAALDKTTGRVVWRSADVTERAHYSSPTLATIAGIEQIVQFARESVFGVKLDGGAFLWKYSGANNGTANVTTPVIDGDHVLAASAYGTGAGLAKVTRQGDGQQAEEVYFEKSMANHHGGIVKIGDHIYGFGSGGLIAMDFLTGEIAWRDRSVGKGSLTYADGHLYCLSERNEMALVEANPAEYVEKGRFPTPKTGRPSWPHPVVANGRLYIRDQQNLTCYDVGAGE